MVFCQSCLAAKASGAVQLSYFRREETAYGIYADRVKEELSLCSRCFRSMDASRPMLEKRGDRLFWETKNAGRSEALRPAALGA